MEDFFFIPITKIRDSRLQGCVFGMKQKGKTGGWIADLFNVKIVSN